MSDDIVANMNAESLEENHIHLKARIEELEAAIQQARADAYAEALEAAGAELDPIHPRKDWGPYALDCQNHAENIRALPNPYRETE